MSKFKSSGFTCDVKHVASGNTNGLGHHCGYVSVPKGHPWHGKDWTGFGTSAPGGITYAEPDGECWCVGFDTNHFFHQAHPEEQTFEYAKAETIKLAAEAAGKCKFMLNACISEIRKALTGKACGKLAKDFTFEGTVILQGPPSWYLAGVHPCKVVPSLGGSKHRTFIKCATCNEWVPFGRLAQHTGSRRGKAKV